MLNKTTVNPLSVIGSLGENLMQAPRHLAWSPYRCRDPKAPRVPCHIVQVPHEGKNKTVGKLTSLTVNASVEPIKSLKKQNQQKTIFTACSHNVIVLCSSTWCSRLLGLLDRQIIKGSNWALTRYSVLLKEQAITKN